VRRARYLILIARGGSLPEGRVEQLREKLAPLGAFGALWSGRRAVMFAEGPHLAIDSGGVAGWVFRRGRHGPIDALSPADSSLIANGGGQFLVDAHWGGYVALIERDADTIVLRSPLADLSCLMAVIDHEIAIASDVPLLEQAAVRRSVDYPALARHLASPDLRRAETCLSGVTELQGGLRLAVGDGPGSIEEVWTPWKFAARDRQIEDSEEAGSRLRDAVLHAVAASCHHHGDVILRLSGGLDSSIVAASLVQAGIPTAALNLVTNDAAGDERRYARRVAQALDIRLEERLRQLASVDLTVSAAAGLPRPTARSFVQAAIAPCRDLAREIGAAAIVDGGGGDNVFCSLQSIRPVLDCMISGQPWKRTRATTDSVAAVSQVSRWMVLRRAAIARVRRIARYDFALDCRLLSASAIKAAQGASNHRWLDCPAGALPGKAAHVGIIAAAQSVVEGFDPRDSVPLVSPVVEACLSIPTWLWYDRGLNRAMARHAFAGLLPRDVIERRSKGGPDGFIAELFQERRQQVKAILFDGLLMRNGLLDQAALASALAESGPVQSLDFMRVMRLVDAEIWAQSC
jgi:asparagine synthase (glutamine-hydrolysing)